VILANPPFKGSIDESDINPRFGVKTKKTELLFVELIYDLLESGGRAAVIVPDGVLFGTSNAHQDVRKILVDKCTLDGIISMPSGVFKPYAGVSTAVLLFTKAAPEKDYHVWFYDMQADGFSLDDKRQKIADNDIDDIIKEWKKYRKTRKQETGNRKLIFVNTQNIRANKYDLSISRYKPVEHKAVEYERPEVLMDKVMLLEEEIVEYVKNIKKEI
jgi:type I restriction enzyme M protein